MSPSASSVSFSPDTTASVYPALVGGLPSAKKQKMSITQTYHLANSARGKLSSQAARPDHNLRLLVGHANLLDALMVELAEAEQEQERWFNQTVRGAARADHDQAQHVRWEETIVEEPEDDWALEDAASDSDSSDSDLDDDEDDEHNELDMATAVPLRKIPTSASAAAHVSAMEVDDAYDDDEDDSGDLALVRTSSHQPPDLLHDSDEDSSEDDLMPPSPPDALLDFSETRRKGIATTSFYDDDAQKSSPSPSPSASLSQNDQSSFFEEGYYLPQRTTAAISAY
ncbi:MAG: hypothetical protein M1837_005709 [Sclerophora amabilis]|nr:MAG: hypothetical protein M1837_005709 [Sclerophora amabilis]